MNNPKTSFYRWAVYCTAITMLAACVSASPPTRFYTLSRVSDTKNPSAGNQVVDPAVTKGISVEVRPVEVPERLKRSQIVINANDSARVNVLETERWASALNDELHDAFANQLRQRFQPADTPNATNHYRVHITLDQLSIVPSSYVSAAFHWQINHVQSATDMPSSVVGNCNFTSREAIGNSVDSAVQGLQKIVAEVSQRISGNIGELGQQKAIEYK